MGYVTDEPKEIKIDSCLYIGTSNRDIARSLLYDINTKNGTYGQINLSTIREEPIHEAHGIVWKVCVDSYDAQDEFEKLPPLGVGKHKFEVYFNRPMNVKKAPNISFGVRDPYTQVAVAEDGSWSADSTIYTAYVTITGKTSSDGLNRIYVYGAEDNEFFECPYEKTRFNVIVQSAGSMATGFSATPGLGRVDLNWDNKENDFTDAMGFNLYRYQNLTDTTFTEPVKINEQMLSIDTKAYTDYDVQPNTTYYYMYKVLSTDLKEYDASNVVSATVLTSEKGDANGSGAVDVADVITTVNYAAGMEPKPFIFDAADMNTDKAIDILDVIGIIQHIINPNAPATASVASTATYTLEDGIVYVDSPVELAGVQVQLATEGREDITTTDDLKGFEQTSAWLSDNDYIFLAYNLNGKTLTAGKHALLKIGDSEIAQVMLSDKYGHNVQAIAGNTTGVDRLASDVMRVRGVYTINGIKIGGADYDASRLPHGVYIINGEKVVK